MRGNSQAWLVETSDGAQYVIKALKNPQLPRSIINEWIASGILMHLGIQTPQTLPVFVSEDFLQQHTSFRITTDGLQIPLTPG
jgi:hypothetical protein